MLARLGSETAVFHGDADADVDRFLFKATSTVEDYRSYLVRLYGFLAPLETALAATDGLPQLLDLTPRAKAPLIAHDLLALGVSMHEIQALPRYTSVPVFRGPATALGWMYVAERPMLASAVIRRHLATRLPTEIGDASSYLSCYVGLIGTMWRELGEVMDRIATTSTLADRIVLSACDAFRALNRWRLQDAMPRARAANA